MGPTKPPIGWVAETISQGIKLPELEADHLSAPSSKLKMIGTVPLQRLCRGNFTFSLPSSIVEDEDTFWIRNKYFLLEIL